MTTTDLIETQDPNGTSPCSTRAPSMKRTSSTGNFDGMGIYIPGRVGNELRELSESASTDAEKVYRVTTMHYLLDEPMKKMAEVLTLKPRVSSENEDEKPAPRVLDVGSGYGGDANLLATKYRCTVTALEIQQHISRVAESITRKLSNETRVFNVTGDITNGKTLQHAPYDGAVSVLAILHIPDREKVFKGIRSNLKLGATLYIEDYFVNGTMSDEDTERLRDTVACPYLPTQEEYTSHLARSGFGSIAFEDVTEAWSTFVAGRCAAWADNKDRHVRVHGEALYAELAHFYNTVNALFQGGNLRGARITAVAN